MSSKGYVPRIAVPIAHTNSLARPRVPRGRSFHATRAEVMSHYTAIVLALSFSSALLGHDSLLMASIDLLF